jgi:hypothetical protein
VVGGDAGVGKTRLLAEFTGGLEATVLRGGCLPLGATGMPFSPIVEVLRGLTGDGASRDGLGGRPLPESSRDLLLVRVEALRPPAGRLLRVAAAGGRRFDPALLAAVTGQPQPEVVELLREAVDRQLLVPLGRGFRFRHALLREALQLDLLPGEREAVYSAYARAMAGAPQLGGGDEAAATAELAYHWHQAGDLGRALRAWVQAGRPRRPTITSSPGPTAASR